MLDRVLGRRDSGACRGGAIGDQKPAAVHLRGGRRLPRRPRYPGGGDGGRGAVAARPHAGSGEDAPQPADGPRIARTRDARGEDRSRPRWSGERGARGGEHGEPPDHRGVHARRQRGRGRDAGRGRCRVSAADPSGARSAKAPAADGVRLGTGVRSRHAGKPLRTPAAARHGAGPSGGACRALRRAPQPLAGRLWSAGGWPLRAGQRLLLPLHIAHPPLSRSHRSPGARTAGPRPPRGGRRTAAIGRGMLAPRTPGRGGRAGTGEAQTAPLPQLAHGRGDERGGDRSRVLRSVRAGA